MGANKNSDQLHIFDTMIERSRILQHLQGIAEEFEEPDLRDYYEDDGDDDEDDDDGGGEDEDDWDDGVGYY
jgi:hypothetical protein